MMIAFYLVFELGGVTRREKESGIAVTGSINAMTTGQDIDARIFNSGEWLPLTIDDAIKAQHPYISYCVAKAESEKAIWKFVEDEKPSTYHSPSKLCLGRRGREGNVADGIES